MASGIEVLDCTLRDGGYCNDWKFDSDTVKYIVSKLDDAGVEIIEVGYLSEKKCFDEETTIFNNLGEVNHVVKKLELKAELAIMINHNDVDIKNLPLAKDSCVKIIRYAFHKEDCACAIETCAELIRKGYKVFLQPMVTNSYSKAELEILLSKTNEISPSAIYIVDSFGSLRIEELKAIFDLYKVTLVEKIKIGFHAHNNMQLSLTNSMKFVEECANRQIVIDVSVMGMGRGAGNLNSEIFLEWMNGHVGLTKYRLSDVLAIADSVISRLLEKNPWGYSLGNYLSAVHNCHPQYAYYLMRKRTLLYEDMNAIFGLMQEDKKKSFDESYIEKTYYEYLSKNRMIEDCSKRNLFADKEVILIGSGKSAMSEKNTIKKLIQDREPISISLNFVYLEYDVDYVFISNIRRYERIGKNEIYKTIITSNIPTEQYAIKINYDEYICGTSVISDNAMVILMNYLVSCGVKKIYLAGIDGYSYSSSNYFDDKMSFDTNERESKVFNAALQDYICEIRKKVEVSMITSSLICL